MTHVIGMPVQVQPDLKHTAEDHPAPKSFKGEAKAKGSAPPNGLSLKEMVAQLQTTAVRKKKLEEAAEPSSPAVLLIEYL
ncbi:hypothetical protein FIBSPDRAFT_869779 [Athelia psychrophila]|uniref:Uncharacterized protein n=1 Tax=Athelia psychrophila TaxID=1759441 RepID=A0A166BVW7_9AGAM|nr:hypothetical protein FIBSPDRAFT_869779 [Fibularhizoctonia sp. CBS 109695]